MNIQVVEDMGVSEKMAVFDMDNTILRTSFIDSAAVAYGFKEELAGMKAKKDPFSRTKLIAGLLRGQPMHRLLELTDRIDITPGLEILVDELKRRGYITGIISDSYDCVTNHLKGKYGFDFSYSNELEFSNGFATGRVKISSLFLSAKNSQCKHEYCKLNALIYIGTQYKIGFKNIMMIGDGDNDICCLREAGIGVSFCSTETSVDSVADYVIKESDFSLLLSILK